MARCYYSATASETVAGAFNLRLTVHPGDEAHAFDVGVTELLHVTRARCEAEADTMKSLGYELVNEVRAALRGVLL